MSAQHTPGPLMRDNFSVTTCAPAGEKRRTVAMCSPDLSLSSVASMERMRANATLFAAASDLLSELEAMVTAVCFADPPQLFNGVECHEARVPLAFVEGARAAIAKARGVSA